MYRSRHIGQCLLGGVRVRGDNVENFGQFVAVSAAQLANGCGCRGDTTAGFLGCTMESGDDAIFSCVVSTIGQ